MGAGIERAARADVVHVLGGGFVNDLWPRHVGVLAGAVAAARRSGGRAALTGAGSTPSNRVGARALSALADRFDVVDLRDQASAEVVGRPEAVTTDDLFLASDVAQAARAASDAPGHMLCLQSDLLEEQQVRELAAFLLCLLRDWEVDPGDVGVVEGIPG